MTKRKQVAPPTIILPFESDDGNKASPSPKRQKDLSTENGKRQCKRILAQIQLGTLSKYFVPKINHLCHSTVVDVKDAQEIYSQLHNILWIVTCLLKKKGKPDFVSTLNLFCREDRTTECVDTNTLPKQPLVEVINVVTKMQTQMKQCSFIEMLTIYNIVAKALRALHPHT